MNDEINVKSTECIELINYCREKKEEWTPIDHGWSNITKDNVEESKELLEKLFKCINTNTNSKIRYQNIADFFTSLLNQNGIKPINDGEWDVLKNNILDFLSDCCLYYRENMQLDQSRAHKVHDIRDKLTVFNSKYYINPDYFNDFHHLLNAFIRQNPEEIRIYCDDFLTCT